MYQAGKTGTSNYSDDELPQIEAATGLYNSSVGTMAPDESFVGYTNQYAMAVWTGYKNRSTPIYGSGLDVAANVYKAMQLHLNETFGSGSTDFTAPSGVYLSGNYAYLSGSNPYTYSSSSSSVYSNIYGNSSSSQDTSETSDQSSSNSTNHSSSNEDNSFSDSSVGSETQTDNATNSQE